ncbi:MAG: AAA family ATPase [Akkermansiaceae bacterium]|nr:AAA family ATPase [Armatimonadota bacterium]
MNPWDSILGDSLKHPVTAIGYEVGKRLAALFPEKALIEGDGCPFDLKQFVEGGHCTVLAKSETLYNQISTDWHGTEKGIAHSFQNLWFAVQWEDDALDVLLMEWPVGFTRESRYWIITEQKAVAERFYAAVCEWSSEVRSEVLVYENGGWHKSKDLFAAIQGSNFANLILKGSLKQEIADDVSRFFSSRAQYERYGVPWKRGVLFIGPPGNGKTHCVKSLINASGVPCLYVKSFKSEHATDQDNIRLVFQRARQTKPCILVLEDLDSLIDEYNRAFFLNELDGFASNAGIVTLATTNHPERLDASIVDRPSRFDRKYHFELPGLGERQAYIRLWNQGLQDELRLSDGGIVAVAELTGDFSFAYLKELFLSSIMRWINVPDGAGNPGDRMDSVMAEQVESLRQQMATMATETVGEGPRADDESIMKTAMMMRRFRAIAGRRL